MRKRQDTSARASALQVILSIALVSVSAILFATSFKAAAPAATSTLPANVGNNLATNADAESTIADISNDPLGAAQNIHGSSITWQTSQGFARRGAVAETTDFATGQSPQGFEGPTPTPNCGPGGTPGPWRTATPYPTPTTRYGFAQTATHLYVFGGVANGTRVNTVNRMDIATGIWQARAVMPFTSEAPTCALMQSTSLVYCAEGDTGNHFASYDIATDTWTPLAASPADNHYGSALGAFNGKVFLAGGTAGVTDAVHVYDVASNTWSAGTAAPSAFLLAGYQQVGQFLYVVGGFAAGTAVNLTTTWRLNMSSAPGVWENGPTFTMGRGDFGLAYDAGNNKLYALGGDTSGGGFFDSTNEVDELSLASWPGGTWVTSPPSLTAPNRQGNSAGFYGGGDIWSVGGIAGATFQFISEVLHRTNATDCSNLGNISTRLRVETGDNVLIGGFIVTGIEPKRVIVRAIGPSLPLAGRLTDPTLELRDGLGGLIAANDNWRSLQEAEIIATSIPPTNDFESAIVATLPANNSAYTAIVRGANNGTGIGVVEAYDLNRSADSKLANISTRGFVQTGDNVMIGGLIVQGQLPLRVIVRAIGPSLPVSPALADPMLELHDGDGALIATNNNWRTDQEAEIIATGIPPSNDLESAIVQDLTPGNYTAIVRGVSDTTGIALVEVYSLQ